MELRRELSERECADALEQLFALRVHRIDSRPLFEEAWRMRHNVTVADALYVVVARRLGVALVTGDKRLAGAPGLNIEILA